MKSIDLNKIQARRAWLHAAICRKYGVPMEPVGCWTLWPDCIKAIWRAHSPVARRIAASRRP